MDDTRNDFADRVPLEASLQAHRAPTPPTDPSEAAPGGIGAGGSPGGDRRQDQGAKGAPPTAVPRTLAGRTSMSTLAAYLASQNVNVDMAGVLRSVYVKSNRDRALRRALDDGLKHVGTQRRDGMSFEGRGIALLAESGAGKTEAVRRGLQKHPLFEAEGVNGPGSMAISVTCLGSCTLRILGEMILQAVGYDVRPGLRENEIWALVRHHLEMLGILALHVDEVSNLTDNANHADLQRIVNNFKALINNASWPVVLILSGIPSIGPVLKKDAQLRRRMTWLEFRPLRAPDDNATLAAFAGRLCGIVGIAPAPGFANAIAPRLVHASCGQLGLAAEMCVEAVEEARAHGSTILEIGDFADMFASRTGCDASRNPFVNPNWVTTDPRVVLGLVQGEDDIDGGGGSGGSGRGTRSGRKGKR